MPLGAAGQLAIHCGLPFESAGRVDVVVDAYGYFK
jgi:hypothetical protein